MKRSATQEFAQIVPGYLVTALVHAARHGRCSTGPLHTVRTVDRQTNRRQDPDHRAGRARGQPGDRRRESGRRARHGVARTALRGGTLRRGQRQRSLPAGRTAPQPPLARRPPSLRLRQGALLLVAAGRRRHLRHGRLLLLLPGHPRARRGQAGVARRLSRGAGGTRRRPDRRGQFTGARALPVAQAEGGGGRSRPAHGHRGGRHGRARCAARDGRNGPAHDHRSGRLGSVRLPRHRPAARVRRLPARPRGPRPADRRGGDSRTAGEPQRIPRTASPRSTTSQSCSPCGSGWTRRWSPRASI